MPGLNNFGLTLIEFPHSLEKREHAGNISVFRYELSAKTGIIAQVKNFFRTIKKINMEIIPTSKDILFIYTEYEILNQYVVDIFAKVGSRIFLIEDGGFGTYVPFRMPDGEVLTIKEKLKKLIYRMLPGLSKVRYHKINGFIFPWMPDSSINGVCMYKPVAIARHISTFLLKRPLQQKIQILQGKVIFLNEPIYDVYQSREKYFDGLMKIISGLCDGFSEVLFKFHPRETYLWRLSIKKLIHKQFPLVVFIEENNGIEEIIDLYRPSVAASYFCSALLSLNDRGVQPLYLYHLIPDIQKQPIFKETTSILTDLGYNFVASFSDINSNFKSGLLDASNFKKSITLAELIGQNRA